MREVHFRTTSKAIKRRVAAWHLKQLQHKGALISMDTVRTRHLLRRLRQRAMAKHTVKPFTRYWMDRCNNDALARRTERAQRGDDRLLKLLHRIRMGNFHKLRAEAHYGHSTHPLGRLCPYCDAQLNMTLEHVVVSCEGLEGLRTDMHSACEEICRRARVGYYLWRIIRREDVADMRWLKGYRRSSAAMAIDKNMDDEVRSAVLRFVHDMGILHDRMEAVSFSESDSDAPASTMDKEQG